MRLTSKFLHWFVKDYRPIEGTNRPMRGLYQDIHRHGGGALYLRRHFWLKGLGMTSFLHWFATADQDEWVHDHPWRFGIAIVLSGSYLEERVRFFDPLRGYVVKDRRIRWFNFLTARSMHRVKSADPDTWTLFIHFGRIKEWGFFQRQVHEQWVADTDQTAPTNCVVYFQPYLDFYKKLKKDREAGIR